MGPIEYELEHPLELVAKGSGRSVSRVEKLTLRPPEARDFMDLETLMASRPIAFQIGMIQRLAGIDAALAGRLKMSDVKAVQARMNAAGFFDLDEVPEAAEEPPAS